MNLRALLLIAPLVVSACSSGSNVIANMGLGGRVVYSQGPEGLWEIDLESGRKSQLWKLSDGGFISGVAVSPDGLEVVMAYAPETDSPIPRADIYIANADGSNAKPLLVHRSLYEAFNHPTWSPDGQWIYFTRIDVLLDDVQGTGIPVANIERIPASGGEPQLVIEDAEQAHFAADGSRITFLRFNQETSTRSLWVANADGSEQMQSLSDTAFFDLTSPRLSPDGEIVAFAASGDLSIGAVPDRSFWAKLLGAEPAYAHGLPWDYYTMPAKGGEISKISSWGTDGAVLAWSPDGDNLALMHLGGLFVTGWNEPRLTLLTETPNHGSIDWTEKTQ
jgi:Tol biopolymer transport system component